MSIILNTQSSSKDNSPDISKFFSDSNLQFNMLKGITNDLSTIKTKINIKPLPIKPILSDDAEKLRNYQTELDNAIRENETTIDARLKALEIKIDKIIMMLAEIKNTNNK